MTMKIIFFNVWNGQLLDGIADFIKEHSVTTDVFCFQEANTKIQTLCHELIPDYQIITASKVVQSTHYFNSATYVGRGARILDSAVLLENQPEIGLGLYTQVQVGDRIVDICNIHGVSMPGKLDNPDRLQQSQELIEFLKDKNNLKIMGGDFNVLPDTKSILMFQENDYQDLIKDFKITTTRNHLAWDKYPEKLYYSDYVFVSPETPIKSFTVPDLEISDHLPMILEL